MLVVGTEHSQLVFLDPKGQSAHSTITLKSVPVLLDCSGQFGVDYRIFVACRDGRVYQVRDGTVQEQVIAIESKPVGMVRLDK